MIDNLIHCDKHNIISHKMRKYSQKNEFKLYVDKKDQSKVKIKLSFDRQLNYSNGNVSLDGSDPCVKIKPIEYNGPIIYI